MPRWLLVLNQTEAVLKNCANAAKPVCGIAQASYAAGVSKGIGVRVKVNFARLTRHNN